MTSIRVDTSRGTVFHVSLPNSDNAMTSAPRRSKRSSLPVPKAFNYSNYPHQTFEPLAYAGTSFSDVTITAPYAYAPYIIIAPPTIPRPHHRRTASSITTSDISVGMSELSFSSNSSAVPRSILKDRTNTLIGPAYPAMKMSVRNNQ